MARPSTGQLRSRSLRGAVVALGVVLVLAASGCGGSGDETTSTTAESRDDFIAAANAICSRTGDEISGAATKLQGTNGAGALKFFAEVTLPKLSKQYDEIAALPPPEGGEADVDAIVAAGRQAVAKAKRQPELLLAPEGDPTPFDEANRLAGEFGIDQCGG